MAHPTKQVRRKVGKQIRASNKPRTHPRKVKGASGLFYVKAGKVHKVSHSRDVKIKAKNKRSPKSDSWRGDVAGTRY